jgi:RNA-directed DNA polymerase
MGEAGAHFDFLGYRFLRSKKGKLVRLVRPNSKQKLRSTLKPLTKRANGKSMEAIIATINPVLEGWVAYFRQACLREHQELDRWMRVRLRSILRKRNKGKGKGRGKDHIKWPKRAREEQMSLRRGANC